MFYAALAGSLVLADRIARLMVGRHKGKRWERRRRATAYPLTDDTNWRQPSG
ncbi:MAG TPA: hypothetical protein VE442_23600 [Jatrophihabitans sp.]|nr:hypothetical protein [Jatrophihabitans sp.]